MSTSGGFLSRWVQDRLPVAEISRMISRKQVPIHSRSIWYMTGSIPLVLFMVQVGTGALLMTYYQPGMETSHGSVQRIVNEVEFGWLIRSIHSYAANLMILFVYVHMFAKMFTRAFRKPRELTWLTGIGMLTLLYGFGFVGYLLPWDQLAYFATTVGINSVHAIPLVGTDLVEYAQGGASFNDVTLTRFYAIHVIMLPLALVGLLGAHLTLLQIQGESVPDAYAALPDEKKASVSFFPDFTVRETALHFGVLALLVTLAVLFPSHLGPEADPLMSAPEGIKPEWYFFAQFETLKLMPSHLGPIGGELLGLITISAGIGAWALTPFWDPKGRWALPWGVFCLILFLVLTWAGWYF